MQWCRRKSLFRVDRSILALGVFYIVLLAAYVFFEAFPVNYRPVLIDGRLEASYPSSTTLLTLCAMTTAAMQFNSRIKNRRFSRCLLLIMSAFTCLMVLARLISGVHWFSDIIGGILLGTALIMLYASATTGP